MYYITIIVCLAKIWSGGNLLNMNCLTFDRQTRTEHNFFFLYRLPGDVSGFSSVLFEYAFIGDLSLASSY